jgi:hypothetical protein
MGYTHYICNPKGFTKDQWNTFIKEAKSIISNSDVPLACWNGAKGTLPLISDTEVKFNGVGDNSHETCMVTKKATDFDFCKTARKPYDKIVVAIYKAARNANPSIELSSDGGREVFDFSNEEKEFDKIASFEYNDKWREVGIIEQDDTYIKGIDLKNGNIFKCFTINKMKHLTIEEID